MTHLRLDAPAKVNLSLAVVGRREDGYHLLSSEMALLELADRLLLMPGGTGLRIEAPAGEDVPAAPQRNLAWRGLLAGTSGAVPMACLALQKHVPAGSGLGGGSSDAAAGWRLGRRWVGAPESADRDALEDLARIGADVPFFAVGSAAALVEGIGERVTPHAAPGTGDEVVLVHPPFSLSTAAVFADLRPGEWSGEPVADGVNDLLAPALRLRPELEEVRRLLVAAGALPRLSGSGPTFYARTDDPERAEAVARRLERAGLRVTRTRLRAEPARIESIDDEAEEG